MNSLETVSEALYATAVLTGFTGLLVFACCLMADSYGGHPQAARVGTIVGIVAGPLAFLAALAGIWAEVLA